MGVAYAVARSVMERWRMRDPFEVASRLQEQEIKRDTRIIEGHMGRKLKSVSERIQRDMYQWGEWAKRPQFWANLNVSPFCRVLGQLPDREPMDFKLDPQSMAIHKAIMSLDDSYKIVLYAYYVLGISHEDRPEFFNARGVSRSTYYRRLDAGSALAHGRAMRMLERHKINCEII